MTEAVIRLVLGKRGCGKSYYVKQDIKDEKRLIVYDTMGEYTDFGVPIYDIDGLIDFWTNKTESNFRIIYQPLQPEVEFDYVCRLVYACRDLTFVAEEIDTFCSPSGLSLAFANIIQRGRHKNIEFYGVSQRPYGIARSISAQAKEIVTFKQTEPRDIEYLKTYIGRDIEGQMETLGQYEFLRWTAGEDTLVKGKK